MMASLEKYERMENNHPWINLRLPRNFSHIYLVWLTITNTCDFPSWWWTFVISHRDGGHLWWVTSYRCGSKCLQKTRKKGRWTMPKQSFSTLISIKNFHVSQFNFLSKTCNANKSNEAMYNYTLKAIVKQGLT